MNKYLWSAVFTACIFIIWNLGHVAASRNNITLKGTWLGTVYAVTGLVIILINFIFCIKGLKTYFLSADEDHVEENTSQEIKTDED
ncbi:MAG: hypothetical protein K6E34_09820 [Lachnospiraceae bacterium]|nr:hypothetical protein [Lachnospiraceae bacterium]